MLFFIILFLFHSSIAYAYVDPAGIGTFLSLLISGLISGFYIFRIKVKNFFNHTKSFFKDSKFFFRYLSQKKKIIFFVENKSYAAYLITVVNKLSDQSIYIDIITAHDVDLFDKNNFIRVFKFNLNFFKILAFNTARCNLLVSTTPDLGTSEIKKNKNCKYYYIFHSLVGTQIIYKNGSFNNFDFIACATSYQKEELINDENEKNLPKKILLNAGYPLLDYIKKNQEKKSYEDNSILIAPSWNSQISDYYYKYFSKIVREFLNNNLKVIFRPHPEYKKKNIEDLINFEKEFLSNKNFIFDNSSNFDILKNVEFLLTDWSGIAFEFSFLNKRPVIFLETPRKINNKINYNNNKIKDEMVEFSGRNDFGVICDENLKVNPTIDELRKNKEKFKLSIENFFNVHLYEINNSSNFIAEDIVKRNDFISKTNKK